MLPKLYKSKHNNEIIQQQQCAYINMEENMTVEIAYQKYFISLWNQQ